ncbi:multidrug resistance-associated ABC transporter [Mycena floridula]|nr:multidrug resistance-associated ABC transporter [Mycena floridula]
MYNPLRPPPAPPAFGAGKVVPEEQSSFLSRLVFGWLSPFLGVGFSRPLEKEDLWELPPGRLTASITGKVERNFYALCPPEKRPAFLRDSSEPILEEKSVPGSNVKPTPAISEPSSKDGKAPIDFTLLKALHQTFFYSWWTAGVFQLLSDTLKTTTPLLNKVLLTWLTESYVWFRLSPEEQSEGVAAGLISQPRGIGYGIGLAFALFAMQEVASLMTNHCMQIGMRNGLLARTAVIGNIFRKSLRLSGKARLDHSVGQITTLISTDATRFDHLTSLGHHLWVSPIQIVIGFGLLIGTLGYSALVGLGVLIVGLPIQLVLVTIMFSQRAKAVKVTDSRVRLITEVLQGIRLIKLYGWENFYISRIEAMRVQEISAVRKYSISTAALIGLFICLPTIATIMSFITYSLSGHNLTVAVIFTSLQFFNIIRIPLILFPMVLSLLADSFVAMGRISKFLTAEELEDHYTLDTDAKLAISVIDGDFTWETAGKPVEPALQEEQEDPWRKALKKKEDKARIKKEKQEEKKEKARVKKEKRDQKKAGKENVLPVTNEKAVEAGPETVDPEPEKPFVFTNLNLSIQRGAFIGIVGTVASGKSSILQALIGEMRRTRGQVVFGAPVAYVPQTPWIRNVSVRNNILFGQAEDEDRLWDVIDSCSLRPDLDSLPQGLETEIGEKGINLSGGQKSRISLARAAYSSAEIILLDDPLSAVDAHVGRAIVDRCLLNGPLAHKTRVLVTHALHVLDKMDYIYVVDDGEIKEEGTYEDLMADSRLFSRIMDEYGSLEDHKGKQGQVGLIVAKESGDKPLSAALMQDEERNVGAVSWDIYRRYLRYAGSSFIWATILFFLTTVGQAAQVGDSLVLGFWTAESIPGFTTGQYMALYAALGIANGILAFMLSIAFSLAGLISALALFRKALHSVLRSPLSFFDTTPMGRILSRLSKDQDTLDTELPMVFMQFVLSFASVIGTVFLVFYTFPLLGIIFAPMLLFYSYAQAYYRRTSVEVKRLDSVLRSTLYSSYAETLTGLPTIRAYNEVDRAVRDAESGLDQENRAYYMTVSIQRWLSVRLDLCGNVLILGIALFAAGYRLHVNPAKIAVVLSYTLGITQLFSEMVSQFAHIEQTMNAVERVLVYADLPLEGAPKTPDDPPASWPEKGGIKLSNVDLSYREGLPLVLRGVSFEVHPGEKVGIVGRTGAGKSSLVQALFRTVELQNGSIEIDGFDIAKMGLDVLRSRLAIVPQDSTLFLGTLRQNLDPHALRTDAELISVLRKAWLLPNDSSVDPVAEAKFSLDSAVSDDGGNFSAGEKQLLALCRALVKNSRIIVLDEATSSVDVETDAKLQRTIQTEFAQATILTIAHRLNTIVYYDRVIVMDNGQVAEMDTVLNLFDREGSIFRNLCEQANLGRSDILRIRAEHKGAVSQTSV